MTVTRVGEGRLRRDARAILAAALAAVELAALVEEAMAAQSGLSGPLSSYMGAVLVFLPGWGEITKLHELLEDAPARTDWAARMARNNNPAPQRHRRHISDGGFLWG